MWVGFFLREVVLVIGCWWIEAQHPPGVLTQVANKAFRLELYHSPVACGGAFLGGCFFLFCLSTGRTSSCQHFFLGLNWKISSNWLMWNMLLFCGWTGSSPGLAQWPLLLLKVPAHMVAGTWTLTGGSSGGCYAWSRFWDVAGGLELPKTNSILSFLPSSHCRRSSGPPVCHLPDPALGLSHEEKGRGQLRPGEETHLQKSPHKWVLCLKLSSTLCPSRDKQTVWKHCALRWDVLNKCFFFGFGLNFKVTLRKNKLPSWPFPSHSANKGPMKYKESEKKNLSVFFFLS